MVQKVGNYRKGLFSCFSRGRPIAPCIFQLPFRLFGCTRRSHSPLYPLHRCNTFNNPGRCPTTADTTPPWRATEQTMPLRFAHCSQVRRSSVSGFIGSFMLFCLLSASSFVADLIRRSPHPLTALRQAQARARSSGFRTQADNIHGRPLATRGACIDCTEW
jgi:hypothetical protein